LAFKWFSVLAFAAGAYAEAASGSVPIELKIETTYLPPGDCPVTSQKGDQIHVHYTGKLWSTGEKFDSSYDRGQPLPLKLGTGQVIQGWDEGLIGMCTKEKRTLTIPANMAYGERGFGDLIPPASALVFDVELIGLYAKNRDEL